MPRVANRRTGFLLKLTASERARLERNAKRAGLSMSAWARWQLFHRRDALGRLLEGSQAAQERATPLLAFNPIPDVGSARVDSVASCEAVATATNNAE